MASEDVTATAVSAEQILVLKGVSRAFGHVQALDGVDLDLRRGEILGIVGDNGAGKSTLMKIVAGTVRPDAGSIEVDRAPARIESAADARRLGIEMIYQDLALFDNLSIAANIFIGREPTRGPFGLLGFLRERRMHAESRELLDRMNIAISSTRLLVEGLSGGQRQMVAVARAIAFESRILIMDEPSAALGTAESATLLGLIRGLRDHGVSVIVISHRIPEVLDLADRVLVMKRGRSVAVVDAQGTSVEDCVNLIVAGRCGAVSRIRMSSDAAPAETGGKAPRPVKSSVAGRTREILFRQGLLLFLIWIALIVFFTIELPFFLTVTNAVTIFNFSVVTFLAATGFTIALIGGGLDLSVGSVMMIPGVIAGTLFLNGVPLPIAFLLGFLSGPLVGLINGLLVTRLRINPLIATLSMLFVVRGVGFLIADSRLRQVRDPGFRFAREYVAGMPVAVYFLIAVFVFAFVLIRYTKFGRHIAAVGGNPEAARQAVMNVERYRLLFYTVSGAFAGLAGILLASIIGASDPNAGTGRELVVATAVFLGGASLTGGKGSIVGTLLGVLFVTTLANGLTQMGAPPQYVPIVLGILLIGAVAIDQRPKGGYR